MHIGANADGPRQPVGIDVFELRGNGILNATTRAGIEPVRILLRPHFHVAELGPCVVVYSLLEDHELRVRYRHVVSSLLIRNKTGKQIHIS